MIEYERARGWLSKMNNKVLVIALVAVLATTIGSIVLYSQNQPQQTNPYTVTGTLSYAPGHAIYLGISASSITPPVSPQPSARSFVEPTFTEPNGQTVGGHNDTVASFIFLNFSGKFTFPPNSGNEKGGFINYPVGFAQGDIVEVSGQMSYSTFYQAYLMNVTSITHYIL